MKGERLRLLVLRDQTGESWQVGVPLFLFRFLLVSFVILVILGGITVTWLGVIAARLQAAELIASENRQLRSQLTRVGQLQEEVARMAEREKLLMALTQSFLDDPVEDPQQASSKKSGLFDLAARKSFLADIVPDRSKQELSHLTNSDQPRNPNLSPLVSDWRMVPRSVKTGTGNTSMNERIFFVPSSEPISSPEDGVVASAGWDPELGLSVRLLLDDGVECRIGDLGQIDVEAGDIIHRGQTIARATPAGGEMSSHLKVRISVNGLAIDPLFAMMR